MNIKGRLTLGIIGCTLLALLTPTILNAQTQDYETNRKIRTCPSRVEPRRGPISLAQAKMYVVCEYEEEKSGYAGLSLYLIDILSLQIAPKSRPATMQDIFRYPYMSIDLEKPAYDIRGSIIKYTCESATRNEGRNRGKNCRAYISPKSSGACYQNTFGDWHCIIGGLGKFETKMPPPIS